MVCTTGYRTCSNLIGQGMPVDLAVAPASSCPACGEIRQPGHVCSLQRIVQTQPVVRTIPLHDTGQNEPELLTLADGTTVLWKRWGSNDSVAEVFAWEFAGKIGLDDLVPETTFYEARPGTAQRFVDAPVGLELDDMAAVMKSGAGERVALFDYLTAQRDRHEGNWLYRDGQVVAVDNGNALINEQTRSPFYALHRGKVIPASILAALRRIEKRYLDEAFALLKPGPFGKPASYYADRMWQRIQKCVEEGVIP